MIIGGVTPPLPLSHSQAVMAGGRASEPLGPIKPAPSVPVAPARASMESVPPRSCRQRQTRHGEWRLSARASVCLGGAGLMGRTPAPQSSLPPFPCKCSWLGRCILGGDRVWATPVGNPHGEENRPSSWCRVQGCCIVHVQINRLKNTFQRDEERTTHQKRRETLFYKHRILP